jgi:hypothetical protein
MNDGVLREHLQRVLVWSDAHADWKQGLDGIAANQRGAKAPGVPYSAWELLEHVRIAQWDILEFCRKPKHVSPEWPSGYWPKTPAPPNAAAWDKSVEDFENDVMAMAKLIGDPKTDLFTALPHGTGQTVLRETLLLADHNSYHLGQLVLLRRMLGAWPGS